MQLVLGWIRAELITYCVYNLCRRKLFIGRVLLVFELLSWCVLSNCWKRRLFLLRYRNVPAVLWIDFVHLVSNRLLPERHWPNVLFAMCGRDDKLCRWLIIVHKLCFWDILSNCGRQRLLAVRYRDNFGSGINVLLELRCGKLRFDCGVADLHPLLSRIL